MSAKIFYNKMIKYLDAYQKTLSLVKPNEVIVHYLVIHQFILYLYNYHLIASVDQITVSMANSKFYAFYTRKNKERISKETMKKILTGFFLFISEKHGIRNEKLMKGFNSHVVA